MFTHCEDGKGGFVEATSDTIHFDVVIPFGGNFDFLIQTVESVITQDYSFWHIYILDDNTQLDELQSYILLLDNPKVTLIPYKHKLGIKKIFDESISTFKNEWGMILGADDLLGKHFLYEMSLAIKEFPKSILIQPSIKIIDSKSLEIYPLVDKVKSVLKGRLKRGVVSKGRLTKTLALGNWMYFGASMFNTKFLKENRFNPDLQIAMDYELILRIVEMGGQIVIWPDAEFSYRRHSSSYSNSPEHLDFRFKEEMKIMKKYSERLEDGNQYFTALIARAGIMMRIHYLFAKIRHKIMK
jgi:GT2 family glycosyltransferase